MAIKLQIRRGTAANWTSATPTLVDGEIGYETDTGNFKIGNGTNPWTTLPYVASTYPQTTVSGTDLNAAGYLVQGRYLVTSSVTSGVPTGWSTSTDAPGVLTVTKLADGKTLQMLVATSSQKAFMRTYVSSYTTWVAISNHAQSITTTELADAAVTTVKIADATSTTTGVTNSKIRQSAARSVIGNSTNATAAPADISTTSASGAVLREDGAGSIGFGTVATAGIANSAVTLAKIANIGASTILGNNTGSAAAPIALTVAQAQSLLALGTAAYEDKTKYFADADQIGSLAIVNLPSWNTNTNGSASGIFAGVTNSSTAVATQLAAAGSLTSYFGGTVTWSLVTVSTLRYLRPSAGTWTVIIPPWNPGGTGTAYYNSWALAIRTA